MSTNIVPRTSGSNDLGTATKKWGNLYTQNINGKAVEAYIIAASRSWQPLETYQEGDICYPSLEKGKSFMVLECESAGITGSTEPAWGNIDDRQNDGSVIWKIKKQGSGSGGSANMSGIPIGTTIQHLGTVPPDGFLALKGQEIGRDTYPQLWKWVKETSGLLTSETDWQTAYNLNNGNSAYYSDGDGSTTFRLPNITSFLRPQGNSNKTVGEYQPDAIRNITGEIQFGYTTAVQQFPVNTNTTKGVFKASEPASGRYPSINYASGTYSNSALFDASLVVPTAEENRPKNITLLLCVKAFDSSINQGTIDITKLSDDVSNLALKVDEIPALVQNAVESSIDFTFIYPNGGTKDNPALIATNNRYIEDNPFPGHMVICQAEIQVGESWGQTGWIFADNGRGVIASHLMPDDKIVVQTGSGYLSNSPANTIGNTFGSEKIPTTTPCRVKVWKVK